MRGPTEKEANMTDQDSGAVRAKGRAKEVLGRATGDRRTEALGHVEAVTGHEPTGEELEEAERRVRADHGDIGAEAE
jgi:uncharacterized protein YjbJ (UPF0337 family)